MVQITPVCIFAAYVFICRTMHFKIKYQYKQNRFADKDMVSFSEFIHILFLKRYFVQMFIIRHVESDFSPSFRLNMQPISYNKWFHIPQCDQHWYSAGADLRTFKEGSKMRIYTWWRHQMKTLPRYWSFVWWIYRSPVNSRTKARKTRTQLCYVVNIMAADVLATKWARASVTIILTLLNRDNSVPASSGLKIKYLDFSLNGSHFLYVFIVYHFKSTTPFYAFPVDSAKNTNR